MDMANDIKPRNIKILRNLPISQMTDEEIVKATMDRLGSKSVILGYLDDLNEGWHFIFWYRTGFFRYVKGLNEHLDKYFKTKTNKINEDY